MHGGVVPKLLLTKSAAEAAKLRPPSEEALIN
jgi:hypothetical protein